MSDASPLSPRCSVPPARALRSSRSSHMRAFSCSVHACRGELSSSRKVRFPTTGERGPAALAVDAVLCPLVESRLRYTEPPSDAVSETYDSEGVLGEPVLEGVGVEATEVAVRGRRALRAGRGGGGSADEEEATEEAADSRPNSECGNGWDAGGTIRSGGRSSWRLDVDVDRRPKWLMGSAVENRGISGEAGDLAVCARRGGRGNDGRASSMASTGIDSARAGRTKGGRASSS